MDGSVNAAPWQPYDYSATEYDYSDTTTDEEGFHELTAFCEPNVALEAVTALAFDSDEEALWSGTSGGRIVSYLCPRMEKYSSWKGHADDVRAISTNDVGVLSLSATGIRFCSKGGYTHFSYTDKELPQLQCMTFTNPRKSEVLLGGIGEVMTLFDLKRGKPIKEIPVSAGVTAMAKSSRYIAVGHSDGKVTFRDPRTHRVEHTFSVHTAGVNDIDIRSDIVVTCGFGSRMGNVFVDPLVKVIDTRTMRVLLPLSVPTGPYFARFHPKFSSTIVVVSQQGRYELCDVQSGVTGMQRAVMDTRGQPLLSFDIAPTGESMTFGDAVGYIHQFADRDEFRVNVAPKNSLEVLDMRPPPSAFKLTDNSSLTGPSAFTIPHQIQAKAAAAQVQHQSKRTASLLSEWSHDMYFAVTRPPEPIDSTLAKSARQVDFVAVIPNTPGTKLRNQVRRAMPPQIERSPSMVSFDPLATDTPEIFSSPDKSQTRVKIRAPRNYRHIPIKATKLGFEDFDFQPFNKTHLTGLENIMPNSYVNPVLQMYYYLPQMRAFVLNHLCASEKCLMCEMSFLFHMLDTAKGEITCQAANFIKIFREIPEVSRLGLLQEENASALVPWLVTRFNSFFMQQLNRDARGDLSTKSTKPPAAASPTPAAEGFVENLFGSTMRTTNHCQTCNQETTLDNTVFYYNLTAPQDPAKAHTFSTILKQSLGFAQTTHTWCETCQTFQQCEQSKDAVTLPNVLVLHCDNSPAMAQFWASVADDYNPHQVNDKLAQWIPFIVQTEPSKSETGPKWNVYEFNETPNTPQSEDSVLYELTAVVSSIQDNPNPKGHTTVHCKVQQSYHDRASSTDSHVWYLFNDFHVLPTSKYEASHINADWKSPSILVYKRKDLNKRIPEPPVVSPITDAVMYFPNPHNAGDKLMKTPNYSQFTKETLPTKGDKLAIDAEFVRVRDEEAIERPGGTRTVVRPSELSLARVSVLATSTFDGKCMIDDYIATKESMIVDYLTKYSGIRPGDLDMQTSPHHLTSLKAAYLKLRWLVDRGCVFIGHGLQKDFRIINLIVPKEQVIDTVELFYLDRQRKISLKFLAAHLLQSDIQGDTHDSIEDSRTALLLYRKYIQLKQDGSFEDVLNNVYAIGRTTQWKLDKATAAEAAASEEKKSDENQ